MILDITRMETIAIVGASSYIGRQLVAELVRISDKRIKVLSRSCQKDFHIDMLESKVEIVEGDLFEPESLKEFFEPACTVINLVYVWGGGETENLVATTNLLEACCAANVKRLIHCSTVAVVGRAPDTFVTEKTLCQPIIEYGVTKLKIEHAILEKARDHFDVAIIRPTSVFGPGSDSLTKLIEDLAKGSRFRNYLKSCLFGRRRMNLVHVSNVVAAILFLVSLTKSLGGQVFIVSDDDSPSNNFAYIECFLMRQNNIPGYSLPHLRVPVSFLAFLLYCLGRNSINPCRNYLPDKLISLGFERPVSFEAGLAEFAYWYRSSYPNRIRSGVA